MRRQRKASFPFESTHTLRVLFPGVLFPELTEQRTLSFRGFAFLLFQEVPLVEELTIFQVYPVFETEVLQLLERSLSLFDQV